VDDHEDGLYAREDNVCKNPLGMGYGSKAASGKPRTGKALLYTLPRDRVSRRGDAMTCAAIRA
jgi:hypothetical protein